MEIRLNNLPKFTMIYLFFCLFFCLFFTTTLYAKDVGKVNFPISCKLSSQKMFNDALALTHNMMYIQAEDEFRRIVKNDPNCAMAYWGIALTQIHPLWSEEPSKADLIKGSNALAKAKSITQKSKLESAFINALQSLYKNWQTIPQNLRIVKWEKAQYAVYKAYPNNADAIALYALAHLATAPKEDKTFKQQKSAGKILEKLHTKYPLHPAGFHYTIHAYDNPQLAAKAEKIARGYAQIAPDVPHALHMPSHIFVRLGLWPETVDWNIRSAAAAKRQQLASGVMSMHYAHAMDYLMYAYLQLAQDEKAKNILEKINAVDKYQQSFSTAYGVAAARVRYYLEQGLWDEAMQIPLKKPKNFPWDHYPAVESIIYFAHGLGAIKSGHINKAEVMIEKLNEIENKLKQNKEFYWVTLVESKRNTILAWKALADGKQKQALILMKKAADLEDSVDKHPVTPGEVLPARELLGDMLLKLNKPAEALKAYQATLVISPNRLNSLYGAAVAAEKMGDKKTAKKYFQHLLIQTKNTDTQRQQIVRAREFMKSLNASE